MTDPTGRRLLRTEVAAELGLEPTSFDKLRARRREAGDDSLEPDAYVGATPVWSRVRVAAYKSGPLRDLRRRVVDAVDGYDAVVDGGDVS